MAECGHVASVKQIFGLFRHRTALFAGTAYVFSVRVKSPFWKEAKHLYAVIGLP